VAQGTRDVVLISGFDGGTGASPQTSIKHAGLPWELGLAENAQTLVLNNLRSRIAVEPTVRSRRARRDHRCDCSARKSSAFATAPLVTLGCIMMRVCHLNTCPVGVATQDPRLRANFTGDPEHTVNFMKFIAQEVRELLAQLGVRKLTDLIGGPTCSNRKRRSHIGKRRGWISATFFTNQKPVRRSVASARFRRTTASRSHSTSRCYSISANPRSSVVKKFGRHCPSKTSIAWWGRSSE
jgi:glutamate synthase (ferredoxin)